MKIISDQTIRAVCAGEGLYFIGELCLTAADEPEVLMPQFRRVADAQLQATRDAVKASREKIANQLIVWFNKSQRGEFIGSLDAADQIIKLILEEE